MHPLPACTERCRWRRRRVGDRRHRDDRRVAAGAVTDSGPAVAAPALIPLRATACSAASSSIAAGSGIASSVGGVFSVTANVNACVTGRADAVGGGERQRVVPTDRGRRRAGDGGPAVAVVGEGHAAGQRAAPVSAAVARRWSRPELSAKPTVKARAFALVMAAVSCTLSVNAWTTGRPRRWSPKEQRIRPARPRQRRPAQGGGAVAEVREGHAGRQRAGERDRGHRRVRRRADDELAGRADHERGGAALVKIGVALTLLTVSVKAWVALPTPLSAVSVSG